MADSLLAQTLDAEFGGGEQRRLDGVLPVPFWDEMTDDDYRDQLKAMASETGTGWGVYGDTKETPMMNESELKDVNLSNYYPPIKDQNGHNMCGPAGATTTLEAIRKMCGLPYVQLSAGDLYSRVNGGSDEGSVPQNLLAELMKNGVCSTRLVRYLHVYGVHRGAEVVRERQEYKIGEAWWCPTPLHVASALNRGFGVVASVMWWKRDKLDSRGILPNVPGMLNSREWGGHTISVNGYKKDSSVRGIFLFDNSWTTAWGVGGRGGIPWVRADFGMRVFKWFAFRGVTQSPTDIPPPKENDSTVISNGVDISSSEIHAMPQPVEDTNTVVSGG